MIIKAFDRRGHNLHRGTVEILWLYPDIPEIRRPLPNSK